MFQVVGSEPSFDLAERRELADAAEDMPDPLLFTYAVKLDSPLRTLQNCDPWSVRISLVTAMVRMATHTATVRMDIRAIGNQSIETKPTRPSTYSARPLFSHSIASVENRGC